LNQLEYAVTHVSVVFALYGGVSHLFKEEWMTTVYSTDNLRNVVLLGHGSSGKTSLAEAMLFNTGAINRMGKVEEGTFAEPLADPM
jgi:hypothetical protein